MQKNPNKKTKISESYVKNWVCIESIIQTPQHYTHRLKLVTASLSHLHNLLPLF